MYQGDDEPEALFEGQVFPEGSPVAGPGFPATEGSHVGAELDLGFGQGGGCLRGRRDEPLKG